MCWQIFLQLSSISSLIISLTAPFDKWIYVSKVSSIFCFLMFDWSVHLVSFLLSNICISFLMFRFTFILWYLPIEMLLSYVTSSIMPFLFVVIKSISFLVFLLGLFHFHFLCGYSSKNEFIAWRVPVHNLIIWTNILKFTETKRNQNLLGKNLSPSVKVTAWKRWSNSNMVLEPLL